MYFASTAELTTSYCFYCQISSVHTYNNTYIQLYRTMENACSLGYLTSGNLNKVLNIK